MMVFVEKENEVEFIHRLIENKSTFTGIRGNKYYIHNKDFDLVKDICKRCRA